ncbi:putative LEU/ILE/VAL-binding signal peptide protein [Oxalobacteraceae bacterium IMCC9480]|nr:putative LEU/ILE/VAL-binding signal peptide protein [Oxalobacteraceae bacterium IMCC9480]
MSGSLLTGVLVVAASTLSAKELVVAQVAPFAGNLAGAGRDFNLGVMISFEEINAKGGINGNKLRLTSRDDGYRIDETLRLVDDVIDTEQPIALVGLTGDSNIEALLKKGILEQARIPVLGVRSGAMSLRQNRMLFHIRPSLRDEAAKMTDQLASMGMQRIAVFYEDDSTSLEGLAGVEDALRNYKLKLVASASYKKGSVDVDSAIASIGKVNPAAVIMLSNTISSVAFAKKFREQGQTGQLLIGSLTDAEQFAELAGPSLARGIAVAHIVPSPYQKLFSVANDFDRLTLKLGLSRARANYASFEGYLTARILADALLNSGTRPTRETLYKALEAMRDVDVGGFIVNFSPTQRSGSSYINLSVFGVNGRILQ